MVRPRPGPKSEPIAAAMDRHRGEGPTPVLDVPVGPCRPLNLVPLHRQPPETANPLESSVVAPPEGPGSNVFNIAESTPPSPPSQAPSPSPEDPVAMAVEFAQSFGLLGARVPAQLARNESLSPELRSKFRELANSIDPLRGCSPHAQLVGGKLKDLLVDRSAAGSHLRARWLMSNELIDIPLVSSRKINEALCQYFCEDLEDWAGRIVQGAKITHVREALLALYAAARPAWAPDLLDDEPPEHRLVHAALDAVITVDDEETFDGSIPRQARRTTLREFADTVRGLRSFAAAGLALLRERGRLFLLVNFQTALSNSLKDHPEFGRGLYKPTGATRLLKLVPGVRPWRATGFREQRWHKVPLDIFGAEPVEAPASGEGELEEGEAAADGTGVGRGGTVPA
jgi:hypothetical protein